MLLLFLKQKQIISENRLIRLIIKKEFLPTKNSEYNQLHQTNPNEIPS